MDAEFAVSASLVAVASDVDFEYGYPALVV